MNQHNLLKDILANHGLQDIDATLAQKFFAVVQSDTLGKKVNLALEQRKQGHFDKAMLHMSEANRDQVLAIRAIQAIFDDINGATKTEVIFEKYRQFPPFQIGITNGENVLQLLNDITMQCDFSVAALVAELHEHEVASHPLTQELDFHETRMQGKTPQDEINALKENINALAERVFEIKSSLIENILSVIQEKYPEISNNNKISLCKNAYLILSSAMPTMDAKFVQTENA